LKNNLEFFAHLAHLFCTVIENGTPLIIHFPGGRFQQPQNESSGRCFAAAAFSGQTEYFAFLDIKGYASTGSDKPDLARHHYR
jgi:hypothetical protein